MRVTVVVPTKNAARTIEACLLSIRRQTHRDLELVVVDNHSTDGTAQIAARYAHRVEHAGPERSAQRNIGWRLGTGDIVVFVDADMTLEPEVVAEAVDMLGADTRLGTLVIPEHAFGKGFFARCRVVEKECYLGDPAVEAARVFRRQALERVSGFDEGLTAFEDWDLADRVAAAGYRTGRLTARVWHDEGTVRLRVLFAKKRYYGRWLTAYRDSARTSRTFSRRRFLRRLAGRSPAMIAGVLILKLVEMAGMLAGARISPRAGFLLTAYALPGLVSAVAVAAWFRHGKVIASGDVTPYVRDNLAGELTSLWNHQISGAGTTSAAITQALDVALLAVLPPVAAQYVLFAACTVLTCFGASFLAGVWTRKAWALALAGLLAVANPHVLSSLPNIHFLLAIGLTGLYLGLVLRAAAGGRRRPVVLALLTLPCSYLAMNPALLAVTVGAVIMSVPLARVLAGRGGAGRAFRLVFAAAPLAVLVNLWWAVPFGLATLAPEGFSLAAVTDVGSWAWTHLRSSVANVITLEAHWAWSFPEYFPSRPGPWAIMAWALPVLAVAGLVAGMLVRRIRPAVLGLGGVLVLLVWASKGLHAPLGALNGWAYEHVPGLWLLRDPFNKLAALILLAYVALAAIAFDRLSRTRLTKAALAVCAVSVLAYSWPVWTGAVIPERREGLPGAHVRVPDAWRAVAAEVNADPLGGKALLLPVNDYYQVTTTWGFHGADGVPAQLLHRPSLQRMPGGYYGPSVDPLLTEVQAALLRGDERRAATGLRMLGVSHVIVRRDLAGGRPVRRGLAGGRPVSEIEQAVGRLDGVERLGDHSVAGVFRVPSARGPISAHAGVAYTKDLLIPASLGAATTTDETLRATSAGLTLSPGEPGTFTSSVSGRYSLSTGQDLYHVRRDGGLLRFTPGTSLSLDGRPLPVADSTLPGTGVTAVADARGIHPLGAAVRGESPLTLLGSPREIEVGAYGPLSDCDRYDARGFAAAGLKADRLRDGGVRLLARAHSACVSAPVTGFRPGLRYLTLKLGHRLLSGTAARLCLWQRGVDRCASLPELDAAPGWHTLEAHAVIDAKATGLDLYVYAPQSEAGQTVAEFRAPVLRAFTQLRTVRPDTFQTVELAAGAHRLDATGDRGTSLGAFSALQDCNAGDTASATGMSHTQRGGTHRLTAGSHSTCVSAPVLGTNAGRYRVELEYRTVAGRPARVCLWQQGPDSCAALPDLASGPGWRRLSAVVRPAAGTESLALYLYADGQRNPVTTTEYRAISVSRSTPVELHREAAAPPHVSARTLGPGEHAAEIKGATGRFVLVLDESFAPGWQLKGLPASWRATHFTANGYANGWLIEGTGDALLTVAHRPSVLARLALIASVASLGLTLAFAIWRRLSRRIAAPVLRAPVGSSRLPTAVSPPAGGSGS